MTGWLETREGLLALSFLLGFFGAGIAETFAPRRATASGLGARWLTNLALAGANAWLAAAVFRMLGVAPSQATNLLWDGLRAAHPALALVAAVLVADLVRYAIHRAMHAWSPLWRLHAVHHADHDVDVTTSFRHHPLEYILVAATLATAHGVLGVPADGLAIYAGLTLLWTPFVHCACRLPTRLERLIGRVLVTPRFHAIHHSLDPREGDCNLGMMFAVWDRLFGTAREPGPGRIDPASFGIAGVDRSASHSLWAMLVLPLRSQRRVS